LKASNDSARVGALRTILEALEIHRDIVQTRDIVERLDKIEEMAQNQKVHRGSGSALH